MLDENIVKKIAAQDDLGGIDVSKLPVNCRIVVRTRNSIYKIKILPDNRVMVKGGKYFPKPTECSFNGSTWGGSMLKLHWIGHEMYMEFVTDTDLITTSAVEEAKIIGENWHYDMEWTKKIDPK